MDTQDLTLVRIAQNQSTFREANARIERSAADIGVDGEIPFICECAERTCTKVIRLHRDVYTEIRNHPRRFLSAPGHEDAAVRAGAGRIVEHRDEYVIVEKIGVAGEIAEQEA